MRFPTGGGLAPIFRFLVSCERLGHFSRSKIEATHVLLAASLSELMEQVAVEDVDVDLDMFT